MATQVSKRKQVPVAVAVVPETVEVPVVKRGRKPRVEASVPVAAVPAAVAVEPAVAVVEGEAVEEQEVEVTFLSELERYITSRRAHRDLLRQEETNLKRELADLDSMRRRYLAESKTRKKKQKRVVDPSRRSYLTIPRPLTTEFSTFLSKYFPTDTVVPNPKGGEIVLPGVNVGDHVCPKDLSRYLKVYIDRNNLKEGKLVKLDQTLRALSNKPIETCEPFGIQKFFTHHFIKPEPVVT